MLVLFGIKHRERNEFRFTLQKGNWFPHKHVMYKITHIKLRNRRRFTSVSQPFWRSIFQCVLFIMWLFFLTQPIVFRAQIVNVNLLICEHMLVWKNVIIMPFFFIMAEKTLFLTRPTLKFHSPNFHLFQSQLS